jgi:enamine deaminase RidA (YjgF/YER057c/UK114 family)
LLESDLAWAPTHTLTNPSTEVVDHSAATSILAAGTEATSGRRDLLLHYDPLSPATREGGPKMGGAYDPQFRRDAVIPASWSEFYAATGIPAAVRSGEVLRLTGHTGDRPDGTFSNDPEVQTRQTFQNVALTLAEAGLEWSDVVEITTYRVGLQAQADVVLRVAAEFLDAPYPAWTDVGITELFEPDALFEMSCVAVARNEDRPMAEPAP